MQTPPAVDAIRGRLPRAVKHYEDDTDCVTITLQPESLVAACEALRDDPLLRYDALSVLAYADRHLIYQLVSTSLPERLRLRVPVRDDPPGIESTAFVWPAARWAEQEIRDHWHVDFAGHPNPAPLFRGPASPRDPPEHDLGGMRFPTSLDGLTFAVDATPQGGNTVTPLLGRRHVALGRQLCQVPYQACTSLLARVDGFSAHVGDLAYATAVESLLQVTPPPRAQVLRTIYAECARIASHLYWLARMTQNHAPPAYVAPARAWQARQRALDLMAQWGHGSPVPDAICIGGLVWDAPDDLQDTLTDWSAEMSAHLDKLEALIYRPRWIDRQLGDQGVIDPGTAVGLGVTGPNLRACGLPYDVRTAFPYARYPALDVPVRVQSEGDARSRFLLRLAEVRASLEIVRQAEDHLQPGPVRALEDGDLPDTLPVGTVYAAVEGPRGEWGILLVSQGQANWQSVQIRGPSFANLSALPYLCRNAQPDHLVAILDSLDISAGEVER